MKVLTHFYKTENYKEAILKDYFKITTCPKYAKILIFNDIFFFEKLESLANKLTSEKFKVDKSMILEIRKIINFTY